MKSFKFIVIIISFASCKTRPIITLKHKFSFARPALANVDSLEKQNLGIRIFKPFKIGMSKNYFPGAEKFDFGQPYLFIRDTTSLRTFVSYFYSQPDSTIRLIEYSWNASKNDPNRIERLFDYNTRVISEFLKQTGKETVNKQETWSQKTIIWENDSVYVEQFMLIEGEPTRTRVLISWKGESLDLKDKKHD